MKPLVAGQRCLIVGAGISGLMAAARLRAAGVEVVVIEKARSVGGRMSTRRVHNAVFDHGAQFITIREPVFQEMADEWIEKGCLSEWTRGFLGQTNSSLEPSKPANDEHPRYFVPGGMTALPKHLARKTKILLTTKVTSISLDGGKWILRLDEEEEITGDALILTPPVPQSLDMLDLGGVELPEPERTQLLSIRYEPCLTWMAFPTSERRLPPPGAIQFSEGNLQFLADNQQKGISPDVPSITVHTSADFSREFFELDEIDNWARIVGEVAEYTGSVRRASFHRWRYAKPVAASVHRSLRPPMDPPLVFCGDAFGNARIEGAALSGLDAAQSIMSP